MVRKIGVTVVLTLLGLGLPAVAAAGSLPDLQCSGSNSSVRLREDLTCTSAVVFDASGGPITVDLGGHTLSVPSAQPSGSCYIERAADCAIVWSGGDPGALTVKNGTVIGGVIAGSISHVHITGMTSPLGRMSYSQVNGVVFVTYNTVIDHNLVVGGVMTEDVFNGIPNLTITNNLIVDSQTAGIMSCSMYGFQDVSGTVVGNVIYRAAGDGIFFGNNYRVKLSGNVLVDNGGDGIAVMSPVVPWPIAGASAALSGNTAIGNAGLGFNLRPIPPDTVTNGANNLAYANGGEQFPAPGCGT
jgi:hypothetical protein